MIQFVPDGALQAGVAPPAAPVVPRVAGQQATGAAALPALGAAAPPAGATAPVAPLPGRHLAPAAAPSPAAGPAPAPGAAAAAAACVPGLAGAVAAAPLAAALVWVAAENVIDVARGAQIPALPANALISGDRGIIPWARHRCSLAGCLRLTSTGLCMMTCGCCRYSGAPEDQRESASRMPSQPWIPRRPVEE
ncbi:unnamed protein product [Prorocentrum cordatum]|uniref:Uncharacterized protein n=1 Tax=Prorocentrum cordatum TaxID=2364126 RepID=A0ABN9QH17_9DINO|nr:unnamed protein product [Polarella glacialis]